jgi:2-polyprenyl-6-methoxyphenol hydroxylase-like FAD-dependent oxidoreductase
MRLSRRPSDGEEPLGRVGAGTILVMIDRGAYWQCAYVIPKGAAEVVKARGIEAFREAIVRAAPAMHDRVGEIASWDDVKLLTVKVDRLRTWHRPGLLCIGDAAHAISPIAANLLAGPLRAGSIGDNDLAAVQRRRMFPTRVTQGAQVLIQNHILSRVLASDKMPTPPWPLRLLGRSPLLQRIPARLVGVGVRPEHVHSPDVGPVARA